VTRDSTRRRIEDIWRDVLDEPVDLTAEYFDAGGTSLQAVEVTNRIAAELGVRLSLESFFGCGTVEAVAEEVERQRLVRDSTPSPMIMLETGDVGPTTVILPVVTGQILPLHGFIRALGPGRRLVGFETEPVRSFDAPAASIEAMSERYVELLTDATPDPYVIVGYSYGALIAAEMARRISDRCLLALLDPTRLPKGPPADVVDDSTFWIRLFADVTDLDRRRLDECATERERLEYVYSQLAPVEYKREFPDNLRGASAEDAIRLLRAHRLCIEAAWSYRPEPLSVPVAMWFSEENGRECASQWRTLVGSNGRPRHLPGDHWTFLQPPHVEPVAAEFLRVADEFARTA
jgi:thioesterase domain-containing protein/acyl carrier protein